MSEPNPSEWEKIYAQQYKDKRIEDGFADIKADTKEIKDEVQTINAHLAKLNHQVGKNKGNIEILRAEIFPKIPQTAKELPNPFRDPAIVKLGLIIILAIIVLFAGLANVSLKGVLP